MLPKPPVSATSVRTGRILANISLLCGKGSSCGAQAARQPGQDEHLAWPQTPRCGLRKQPAASRDKSIQFRPGDRETGGKLIGLQLSFRLRYRGAIVVLHMSAFVRERIPEGVDAVVAQRRRDTGESGFSQRHSQPMLVVGKVSTIRKHTPARARTARTCRTASLLRTLVERRFDICED
jgi:hypothetical protein